MSREAHGIVFYQNAVAADSVGVIQGNAYQVALAFLDVTISGTATLTVDAHSRLGTYRSVLWVNALTGVAAATITASGFYYARIFGVTNLRGRITSYSSGGIWAEGFCADYEQALLAQGAAGALTDTEISANVVWPGQNTEALSTLNAGIVRVVPEGVDTNGGANLSSMSVLSPTGDTQTPSGTNIKALLAAALGYGFDGTNFARLRTIAAAVLSGTTQPFGRLVSPPGQWAVTHTPAAATQATISKSAGAAGVRHVASSIAFSLASVGAVVPALIQVNLRDGASGAGTVLWSMTVTPAAATGGLYTFNLGGLNIVGSAATAMTLETSAAPAANASASVALTGWSTV